MTQSNPESILVSALYLYVQPSLVTEIENVKSPFLVKSFQQDMMKFEECENHYETCQENACLK